MKFDDRKIYDLNKFDTFWYEQQGDNFYLFASQLPINHISIEKLSSFEDAEEIESALQDIYSLLDENFDEERQDSDCE